MMLFSVTGFQTRLGMILIAGALAGSMAWAGETQADAATDTVDQLAQATHRPALIDEQALFSSIARVPEAERAMFQGRVIAVDINLDANPGFSLSRHPGHQELRYRMAFNQITEGWNWYPLAKPEEEDYYHAKFLPLTTVPESYPPDAAAHQLRDAPKRSGNWRWDYFLAFENLYDFYPRSVDDDAGFSAVLPENSADSDVKAVRMLALARLKAPWIAESSTFWKASLNQPIDFTLKKRYLFASLLAVWFYDASNGKIIAKVTPAQARP